MKKNVNLIINRDDLNSPVVIGGVGGSGTRVVEEILEQVGFYMGQDLNLERDNLWFSVLFKRPKWFVKNKNNRKIKNTLNVFLNSMVGKCKFNIYDIINLILILIENLFKTHKVAGNGNIEWTSRRIYNMIFSKKIDISKFTGWGWKEPNTHIYIEYLANYFDNLKYIHVIRNGLDMAYSENKNQLINWGEMFEVKFPQKQEEIPKALLDYWIKANNKAIFDGKNILKNNFYLISFDELCINPQREINKLLGFLNVNKNDIDLDKLYNLPKIPKSFERYKKFDLRIFSHEQIKAVNELGFRVEK